MTSFAPRQYESAYRPGIENHFWVAARNRIIYDTLCAAGMTQQRLLDVGCGRGIVVDYLRRRGIDCYGCELAAPELPNDLVPYVQTGVEAGSLPAAFRETVGGILLFDVIEHIDDAPAFLRNLTSAFPRAQKIFITVPAYPELWSAWDEYYGHYRRYTPKTLRGDLLAAGLWPVRLSSFFNSLYIPMRLMSLLGIKRDIKHAAPGRPALHGVIAKFFFWEAKILPNWLIGTSLRIIADVPAAAPTILAGKSGNP
jgi:SAM-dependent methyltransferase